MIARLRRWVHRARGEEGQSTVEYAAVSAAFLLGAGVGWPFFTGLIHAFQVYYGSIYFVLQLPIN